VTSEPVVEMLELIARALVDKPDNVSVHAIQGDHSSILELTVDPSDLGKVIGKKGRTAKSIRTLLGAVSTKFDHRYSLEILES